MKKMKSFSVYLVFILFFSFALPVRAQLSDTIWEGTVTLSGLSLQKVAGGLLQPGPNLANASVTLPVEIWFWNNSNWGVVFRRDKWGLNPRKPFYVEFLQVGEEQVYFSQERQYEGGGSQAPVYEPSRETITDLYTYNPSRRSGTFSQRILYLVGGSTRDAGATLSLSGRFSLRGNTITAQNIIFAIAPNPWGRESYRTSGRLRIVASPFTKTNRKPSVEKEPTPESPGFFDYVPEINVIPPVQSNPAPGLPTPI